MALDAYSPCPCGSGKKFKWCCQPIHVDIDKAFRQDAEGQHDSALRIMEEVTTQHPSNPEAWGRKAQLLFQNDRVDDAEQALQKSLAINPNYAFGYLLQGMFRQHEGEIAGALLLFRKAAELYDPEAKDILAQVYGFIAEAELKLNRPVAARAALKMSARLRPDTELQKGMEEVFGEKSHLPLAARRDYTFTSRPATLGDERRREWDRAISESGGGKLSDAARIFEQLTNSDPDDAAAWYNLALVRAWMGDNAKALEAVDRYVSLESDEKRAADAWALAEVLRFGQGMEDQADYVEHSVSFRITDPQRFFNSLQQWQQELRLIAVQSHEQQGVVTGIVVDRVGLLTAGAPQPAKLGAYLLIIADVLALRSINGEALDRARRDLQERAGATLSEPRPHRGPASFADVLADALLFPIGISNETEARKQVLEHVGRYFEDSWIHRPLRSLSNVAPIDAPGHPTLRKKLRGVIEFLQQCASGTTEAYDFDRLRRKLGLVADGATVVAAPVDGAGPQLDAMGAAELAAVRVDSLTDDQLEQAYRAAQKLDAHELAGHFAKALVARPPRPERSDRFPWYSYLVQRALAENNTEAALNWVEEGEKGDCEHNEGRRRNEYELRRGQVLAKRGETESARDVFERLIGRAPSELRYRGTAAEAMLAMKQPTSALRFAEQGLAKAREQNDRDSEQYFMELVAASRKQAG